MDCREKEVVDKTGKEEEEEWLDIEVSVDIDSDGLRWCKDLGVCIGDVGGLVGASESVL